MQVEQHLERLPHRVGAGRGVAAVVESTAAGDVEVEVVVGAAKRRRAQSRDEADLVERIVHRRQHRRQVVHLLACEERPAALDAVRNPRPPQRLLEQVQSRTGREEDCDVPELRRPFRVIRLSHGPALLDGAPDRRCDQERLVPSGLVGALGRLGANDADRARLVGELSIGRDERDVGRLHALGLDEHPVEDVVHPCDHAAGRAEVLDELRGCARERPVPDRVVYRDVGSPEPVDRLLGVAHDRECARAGVKVEQSLTGLVAARHEQRDLGLHGVGVLELVDEDDLEPLAEVLARLSAVAEQVARPVQQVIEVGSPLGSAPQLLGNDELLRKRKDTCERLRAHRGLDLLGRLAELHEQLLHRPAVVRVVPVLICAGVLADEGRRVEDLALQPLPIACRLAEQVVEGEDAVDLF